MAGCGFTRPCDKAAPRPGGRLEGVRALRRWGEIALLVAGGVGLLVFGYCELGFNGALPQVDPRRHGLGTQAGSGLDRVWAVLLLTTTATVVLVAGLPTGRGRWSRGSMAAAIAQGIGGAVVAGWTLVVAEFSAAAYFTGTDDACTYPDCWPVDQQKWCFVVPGVLTGVVMIVMALLVNRVPWIVRSLVPAAVWVAGLLLQYWIWTTYLLPVFESPPG